MVAWRDLLRSNLASALLIVALVAGSETKLLAQEEPLHLDVKDAVKNRECVQLEDADEVVVCATPQDNERYRIPRAIREKPVKSVPQHLRVLEETPTCLDGNTTPCGKAQINIFSIKGGKARIGPQQED